MARLRFTECVADAPEFVVEASKLTATTNSAAPDSPRLTGMPIGKRTRRAMRDGLPEPDDGQTHRDVAVGIARNLREAGTPREVALFVLADILDRDESVQDPGRPWTEKDARAIVGSVYRRGAPDRGDYERVSPLEERLRPVDLAERWDEDDKPRWTIPGLFLAGKYHEFVGAMGSGKSLLLLGLIVTEAFPRDIRVAYLDEENGPEEITRRLRDLGASREDVSDHFLYLPGVMPAIAEASEAVPAIAALDVGLAVFDSLADFYVAADLDELSNKDATLWSKAYPEALAHDFGIATVGIDHTGHADQGRARGATAKGAKADATWMVEVEQEFDKRSTGRVRLRRGRKNRQGVLPESHMFQIGGTRAGETVFRRLNDHTADQEKAFEVERMKQFKTAVLELLDEAGTAGLSQTKLCKAVRDSGVKRPDGWMRKKLAEYVESPAVPIGRRQEGQKRVFYLVDRDGKEAGT
jgi:hypothetical protein